jgi:sugar phosphate isomerase/epimerase
VVDAYHVWWDPLVEEEIARTRIFAFHIDDWIVPLPEGALTGRGLPGEGHADLARLYRLVSAAGYAGPIEVEVLNERVWDTPGDEVLHSLVAGVDAALGEPARV